MITLPENKFGLTLEQNPHKAFHQSAEDWISENEYRNLFDWRSEEDKTTSIKTGDIWTLQWYPDSTNGFQAIAASSLESLLEFAALKK